MVSIAIAILSGVVLSGSFAPLNWWFLLPIAIAMFLYAVTKTTKPFLVSFLFALTFNFFTLNWTGIFVGLLPVFFLVLLQSLFYIPLGFISFKRNRYSRVWLILPMILIADELRSLIPFGGFGWNRLAFSQADSPYLQSAAYLGDSSLTFLGVCLGIALYLLWARAQLFSVAMILLSTTICILLPSPALNQGSLKVLGVQGNVPRLGLDFNAQAEEVFNYHLKQTNLVLQDLTIKPELIVWPENSVDVDPFKNQLVGQQISELAARSSTPVIVGAVLATPKGPENVSLMWNQRGEIASQYTKRVLTPFGEYIPLRSVAKKVSPLTDNVNDFRAGKDLVLHKVGRAIIAPIICYEIIDDQAVTTIIKKSNMVIVQTNNATFADSGQSSQQLNISRIRAVENNRWILTVSTTGVSAIIDNYGSVVQKTQQNEASFAYGDVKLNSENTLSNKIGNWSSFICILLSLLLYLGKRRKNV
jgi:apolipoprotein N-acyltransferase